LDAPEAPNGAMVMFLPRSMVSRSHQVPVLEAMPVLVI